MWHRRSMAALARFAKRDGGQDLMEYGLLVSLIATLLVGTLNVVGDEVQSLWELIAALQFTDP